MIHIKAGRLPMSYALETAFYCLALEHQIMRKHPTRRLKNLGLGGFFFAAAAAALPLQTAAFADEVRTGEGEFRAWCARCHGQDGRGDGPIAKELEPSPPDLTVLAKNNGGAFPDQRVRKSIDGRGLTDGHGSRQMPSWGNWFYFDLTAGGLLKTDKAKTEAEISTRIDHITGYVQSIQR